MNKSIAPVIGTAMALMLAACSTDPEPTTTPTASPTAAAEAPASGDTPITITAGDTVITATLNDTPVSQDCTAAPSPSTST